MKTRFIFYFLALYGFAGHLHSQNVYSTLNGDIAISISEGDSIRLLVSHKLLASVDYETSKVTFRIPYETFTSGIDSIDRTLLPLKGMFLEFTGKLGITINSKNYNPQKYNMQGTLTAGGHPMAVVGYGTMTCIPAANRQTPACLLLLSIETSLTALNLSPIFKTAKEGVRIDLRQSILERENP